MPEKAQTDQVRKPPVKVALYRFGPWAGLGLVGTVLRPGSRPPPPPPSEVDGEPDSS